MTRAWTLPWRGGVGVHAMMSRVAAQKQPATRLLIWSRSMRLRSRTTGALQSIVVVGLGWVRWASESA